LLRFNTLFVSFPPFCAVLVFLAPFPKVFVCFQKGGGGEQRRGRFLGGNKQGAPWKSLMSAFSGRAPEKTAGKPGPPAKGTLGSPGQNSQPELSGIVLAETTRFGAAGALWPERSDMFSFGACCRQRKSGMLM